MGMDTSHTFCIHRSAAQEIQSGKLYEYVERAEQLMQSADWATQSADWAAHSTDCAAKSDACHPASQLTDLRRSVS